jgi:hypothetical protein
MAAGVTDRLWSVEDLVTLWEAYEQAEVGKSSMIYAKSVLAGILAMLGASFLVALVVGVYVSIVYHLGGGSIGWDPVSLTSPFTWLVNLAIFFGGFSWESRRCRSK